jgi:hypothetical protein
MGTSGEGNLLGKGKLFERSSGHGENFCTGGKGKHSWQVVSFLEYGNFWTRKPSWQGETFWKKLLDKGKTSELG